MDVTHLGLPVGDVHRSLGFYARHFGFDPATAEEYGDGTVIVRNPDGFDLALHPEPGADQIGPLHPFLHFGFRLSAPDEVRTLRDTLDGTGVTIVETSEEPDYVAFKCADPDGHRVEVYWEQ